MLVSNSVSLGFRGCRTSSVILEPESEGDHETGGVGVTFAKDVQG